VVNGSRTILGGIAAAAMLLAAPASAEPSARRLLETWTSDDPMMKRAAEMIAAAFATGLGAAGKLAGKPVFCPPPGGKGGDLLSVLERFVTAHPDMAERPYGDALGASLSQEYPCQGL
jgi:hypothetical protein